MPVETADAAPAFAGEDISALPAYPSLPDDFPLFTDVAEMLAAEAGCDLICEKLPGLTHEEVVRIRAAVRASGVRMLPMLSMRTDPVFLKARELFRAGTIGEAELINTRKSCRYGVRPDWFGERAKYGGTLPWVGIHAADMIHFITGLEFAKCFGASCEPGAPERPDCEDSCAALFELSNGAFATMSVDLLRPMKAESHGDDAGSAGVLEARSNDGVVRLINDSGESEIPADSGPVPFYAELLKEGADEFPLVGPDDGFMLTAAMLAARESADHGGALLPARLS